MDDAREIRMHPLDYAKILRRRFRWFAWPAAACLVLGVLVTFLLPAKYLSSVTIAITGGSVSPDLAHPIDREERIRAFGQHLLEPALLSKVALAEHLTPSVPTESDILAFRQRVSIALGAPVPGAEPGQSDIYVISYSDGRAGRAQRVAQRLADTFVAETSEIRQGRLEETSEFLAARLRETQGELTRIDDKLTAAKARNMGRLPEQTAANLQMLSTLRQQLDSTATQLRGEQDRLRMTQQQISMFAQEANDLAPNQAPTTPQQRVIDLGRRLAEARARYKDNYPDVQDLKQELERAKKEAAAAQSLPPDQQASVLRQNPAYRGLLADRDQITLHLRDLERTMAQINGQIRAYQARLDGAPMIENELQSLTQDRAIVVKQVEELSNRLQTAKLNDEIERKRGSEHFRILYPATLPDAPYQPNRPRLLLLTVGAALFLGVGCVVGREYLDQSIHDARTLHNEFDVPVLGEIPHIDDRAA